MDAHEPTTNETLGQMQRDHVGCVGKLIQFAYAAGYEFTWGEAYRTQEQAQWNVAHHTGIMNSVHMVRLAVDLQLFKDGVYITDPRAYAFLGTYWKTLHPNARWGGDFGTVDADHFSFTYQGRS